ncbi:MAG: molecular chaperone DnaJ [Patescibacteria group bacterium]
MADDYYEVLGVSRTATQDEIKRAFRKKAHEFHPDKVGGNEEMFKRVNEAYQVLSDESKRSQYDRFGRTAPGAGGDPFAGFRGFNGFNVNVEDLGDFGDIFSNFFGGAAPRPSPARRRQGSDIQVDVTVSFIESAEGTQRELSHRLYQVCPRCQGNGAEPETPIDTCPTCQGSGTVGTSRQTPFGIFSQQTVCPTCQGQGKTPRTPCSQCRGEGRVRKSRTLEVSIPAGIDDGQVIRLAGKGEVPAGGGSPGDLFVVVHLEPDPELTRDGRHVRSAVTIPFADAALGTVVSMRTLKGEEELRIPPGTQPGSEFRLKGLGFPLLGGGSPAEAAPYAGDHVVTVNVEVPKRLSREQRKLLEEFKNTKKKSGWF